LSGLSRAHVVLITNADRAGDLEPLRKKIRQHTAARIFTSRHVPADLVDTTTGEIKQLEALQDKRILAFAGIARPQSFMAVLRSLGANIRAEIGYPDHYPYQKSDLARLFQIAADRKISMMVTTEKDSVRLKNFRPEGIWALRIELKVVEKKEWEAVLLNGV
jgi:tetraacyldisaccharide 4'-kinase